MREPTFSPPISVNKNYLSLSNGKLQKLFAVAQQKNSEFVQYYFEKHPNHEWALFRTDGFHQAGFYGDTPPTINHIRNHASKFGVPFYLLGRNGPVTTQVIPIADLPIFFLKPAEKRLLDIIGDGYSPFPREDGNVSENLQVMEATIESGLLDKIRKSQKFLLGELQNLQPPGMSIGATCVRVKHKEGTLNISSQDIDEVHKRGTETRSMRYGWDRMQRLHRSDDAILDVYDTVIHNAANLPQLTEGVAARPEDLILFRPHRLNDRLR